MVDKRDDLDVVGRKIEYLGKLAEIYRGRRGTIADIQWDLADKSDQIAKQALVVNSIMRGTNGKASA